MGNAADYLRVQYVPDLFREEPMNVGVVVRCREETVAKFLGESEPGRLDGRTLRKFNEPSVYRQWVEYWRRILDRDGEGAFREIVETSGDHYRVVRGGEVSDVRDDSATDVANYLYSLLVSEGGFTEAMEPAVETEAEEEEQEVSKKLDEELSDQFEHLNILTNEDEQLELVPHPIRRQPRIRGRKAADHTPAYVQENGRLDVIESIDFGSRFKERTRDHAGWMAYMFDDIRAGQADEGRGIEAISVIRWNEEHAEIDEFRYARSLLKAESDQVVNWRDQRQRDEFLESRKEIAFGRT